VKKVVEIEEGGFVMKVNVFDTEEPFGKPHGGSEVIE